MTSITQHAQASHESSSQDMFHDPNQVSEPDMPPQQHAGKVGYGPNYHASSTLDDKVIGLKEELMGKITHNPERFHHGKKVLNGEDRRKKLVGEDEPNPFNSDDKSENKSQNQQRAGSQSGSKEEAVEGEKAMEI